MAVQDARRLWTIEEKQLNLVVLHQIVIGLDIIMCAMCSSLLGYSMLRPDFLETKRKRRLILLPIAAILDIVLTLTVFSVTKSGCPVPIRWMLYSLIYIGLVTVKYFRPYRLNKALQIDQVTL